MATKSNIKPAEQRIEKAHLQIMRHPSFCAWAGLLFVGKWSIDEKKHTAYVNAEGDVKYSRSFVDSLAITGGTDVFVNFLVLHENGHKALMHLTRGKKMFEQSPDLANRAADHVVNNMILESDPEGRFAKMPEIDGKPVGVCDVKYKGWSMKEVYNDLLNDPNVPKEYVGFDTHDTSFEEGEKDPAKRDEAAKALEQKIANALRSGSYMAGKMGGDAKRLLGGMLDPKINWEEQLAEFVMETCQGEDIATYRRPLRRFVYEDLYLPSAINESIGEVVCGVDVSGSVGQKEMTACVGEVVSMCRAVRPSRLRLIYWDDGIRKEEIYTPDQYDDIINLTKPEGGGGTDLGEVAAYVNKLDNVQCAIILTDGYISGGWRSWNMPVLWVLTTRNMVADCGKSLYIDLGY